MNIPSSNEKILGAAIGLYLLGSITFYSMSNLLPGYAGYAIASWCVCGIIVALTSYLNSRLARLTAEEQLEESNAKDSNNAIFSSVEAEDALSAARSLKQFEKIIAPSLLVINSVVALVLSGIIISALKGESAEVTGNVVFISAVSFILFFVFFIAGRYLSGLSQTANRRYLQGTGGYLVAVSYFSFIYAISVLLLKPSLELPSFEGPFAWICILFLTAVGIEGIISFVLSFYSSKKRQLSFIYESRIAILFASPSLVAGHFQKAIKYQFGIDISKDALLRGVVIFLIPFVSIQFLICILFSCCTFIRPGWNGLYEVFGKPVATKEILSEGINIGLPWPFSRVYRVNSKKIRQISIGFSPVKDEKILLWSRRVPNSELFLVANNPESQNARRGVRIDARPGKNANVPYSLIAVDLIIQYTINNVSEYYYGYLDPDNFLENLATRELTQFLIQNDIFSAIQKNKNNTFGIKKDTNKISELFLSHLRKMVKNKKLGINIICVKLCNLQPPTQTVKAFQDVIAATEDSKKSVIEAEKYAISSIPYAKAEAIKLLSDAESYSYNRALLAETESRVYEEKVEIYKKYKEIYSTRSYLDVLEKALSENKKILIATEMDHEVIQLNLKEKLKPELLDLAP